MSANPLPLEPDVLASDALQVPQGSHEVGASLAGAPVGDLAPVGFQSEARLPVHVGQRLGDAMACIVYGWPLPEWYREA